uniref:Knr4/Smi1-like domain-containing protein n=1 Tax=Ciona savignyi TaxID=51511 RepID=H2Y5U7_CIOSA
MLPDDLKSFYLTTDGILLTWNVQIEDSKIPVGKMELHPVAKLSKLSVSASTTDISNMISMADIDYTTDNDDEEGKPPHFDGRSRIFELDSCGGSGKVCLVYPTAVPGLPAQNSEIWFLDRSLNWNFVSESFTTYFRLMVLHMGLPQWQYSTTSIGLTPKAKQWCNLYAPVRLELDENLQTQDDIDIPIAKVDLAKVFKGKIPEKSLKTKPAGGNQKKKQPTQNIAGSKSMTSMRHLRGSKPWT